VSNIDVITWATPLLARRRSSIWGTIFATPTRQPSSRFRTPYHGPGFVPWPRLVERLRGGHHLLVGVTGGGGFAEHMPDGDQQPALDTREAADSFGWRIRATLPYPTWGLRARCRDGARIVSWESRLPIRAWCRSPSQVRGSTGGRMARRASVLWAAAPRPCAGCPRCAVSLSSRSGKRRPRPVTTTPCEAAHAPHSLSRLR
jgi:hypothetical protein